jgi:hypothetical protein
LKVGGEEGGEHCLRVRLSGEWGGVSS